jgi:signal transduction histidine kinase/DNA-binding response OmpR family regulator/ligand-binding sensor domain-containing protein
LNIQRFGIEDGLSHREISCIQKDDRGFLWMGTPNGLNRYDGYRFKWYTRETNGLQSNWVDDILKDSRGLFWVIKKSLDLSRTRYIDIFDPLSGEVASFSDFFGGTPPFHQGSIRLYHQNAEGQLVFLTEEGEVYLYKGSFQKVPLALPEELKPRQVYLCAKGRIWISGNEKTEEGVFLAEYDEAGNLLCYHSHRGYSFSTIYAIDEDNSCSYFIKKPLNKDPKLIRILPDCAIEQDTAMEKKIRARGIPLESLYYGENKGIVKNGNTLFVYWLYSAFERQLDIFHKDNSFHFQLREEETGLMAIKTIFPIDDNQAWIGTHFGLFRIELKPNYFKKILYEGPGGRNPIRGMIEDDQGNLWVASEIIGESLWKVDSKEGTKQLVNDQVPSAIPLPADDGHRALLKTRNGHIWYKQGGKIIEFDPLDYSFREHTSSNPRPVWAFYEDDEGKVWAGTLGAKLIYFENGLFHSPISLDTTAPPSFIFQFYKDRKGQIWLATDGGLFILDTQEKKTVKRFWPGGKGKQYLPFEQIYDLYEDADGTFWLATRGNGLIHWDQENGTYQQFTQANGLSNNTLYAIYEDDTQNFWIPSDFGIIRFDKNTHQVTAYLEKDGITHHEFNRIAHYRAKDGSLYFGSLNGLTCFHPDSFINERIVFETPLAITEFQQFDLRKNELRDNLVELVRSGEMILNPSDGFFQLSFSLLNFNKGDKIRYAYRIDGLDEDWNYQKENYLRLGRLPYGEYRLRIKGQDISGRWSVRELDIPIRVIRPFYLHSWFIFLVGLMLFLAVFLGFKWRTRSLREQNLRLEALVRARTQKIQADKRFIEQQATKLKALDQAKSRFFANISHEFRTPLTTLLGSLQLMIRKGQLDDYYINQLYRARASGKELLNMVSSILELSKLESGKTELEECEEVFFPLIRRMVTVFESHAERLGIAFQLDYHLDKELVLWLDQEKLDVILRNLLSNAFKFTPSGGKVEVLVYSEGQELVIEVRDSGRGIHPEDVPYIFDRFFQSDRPDAPTEGGSGIGLALSREYAELMKGHLEVESELGKGSCFYLYLPKKLAKAASRAETVNEKPGVGKERGKGSAAVVSRPKEEGKILVVEDNYSLSDYLQMLISPYYETLVATNGKEALSVLARESDIQLVISDLMMPVMDGFQLLEHLKEDDQLSTLPVIMLTARIDQKDKLKALRIGVDDYLYKPFEEEELLVRIHNLIERYQTRRSHQPSSFGQKKASGMTEAKPAEFEEKNTESAADQEWLKELEETVIRETGNNLLSITWLAEKMGMSQRHFYRKVKVITGMPPNQYVREIRLEEARRLLEAGEVESVSEVSTRVNFRDEQYFSKLFRKRYGKNPSDLI